MSRPDFPRRLAEFQSRFATEEQCRHYLMACRWPDGYRCPTCGDAGSYELARATCSSADRAGIRCR